MKILLINNEREDFSGRRVMWEGHEIVFSNAGWEDVASGIGRRDVMPSIDREALDRLVSETQRADVVYCETPEGLMLWYVLTRRGLRQVPFVMEDEDMLDRVEALSNWIADVYGENPLPGFVADRRNVWLHHAAAHRDFYLHRGVHGDRLFYMPCSSFWIGMIYPEMHKKLAAGGSFRLKKHLEGLRGRVLCPGANRRDYETINKAFAGMGEPGCVMGARCNNEDELRNIEWWDFVPLPDFIAALQAALFIVVVISDPGLSGGENSITYSMALGKAVVATRTISTEQIIQHGKTGLLIPPGDAGSLRAAVRRLLNNENLREKLGSAARGREKEISAESHNVLVNAFHLAGNNSGRVK